MFIDALALKDHSTEKHFLNKRLEIYDLGHPCDTSVLL
jgi:hypothetical protein